MVPPVEGKQQHLFGKMQLVLTAEEKGNIGMKSSAVIIVGVKLSSECREMLTWIIAKLAQPGDKVVAVHFVRAFSDSSNEILDPDTKRKLDNTFESVLGVYQSICNLKQVRLDIKVVSGISLKKSLVEAAKIEKASKLVLGGTRHTCESLAKYCTRHLSIGCFVLIVEHGHVVFNKEGVQSASEASRKEVTSKINDADENSASCAAASQGSPAANRRLQPLQPTGWPLMHRSISLEKVATPRSLSVVKWALQLPDRLKVAFDKQGGNVVRMLASSAMPDQLRQDNPQRLQGRRASEKEGDEARKIIEPSEHRMSTDSSEVLPQAPKVSFFQKIAHLCRGKPCVRFTYNELQEATANFSNENVVGKGGCSKVYLGTLSDGRQVAVKYLKGGVAETDEELLTEVEILTSVEHPHIIKLLGYYADTETHILVYNFAAQGSLEENLHGGKNKAVLSWETRRKIAIRAAEALVYLHDTCKRPVIHRDVKSSNILLSSSFSAQLSDFGLARWAPTSSTHITCTDVVGTLGYLAPEYFMFGRVNDKTDVFAFGVVLLEIICGRPPIDMSKPKGEENLVAWARPLLDNGEKDKLVDPRLKGCYDDKQLTNMIMAASFCLRQSPQYRPRMARVLRMICGEDSSSLSGKHDYTDEYLEFPSESESNDVRKHLALAMMGVDDDVASESSGDQNSVDLVHPEKNLDEYFGGRYSRSSSFDL